MKILLILLTLFVFNKKSNQNYTKIKEKIPVQVLKFYKDEQLSDWNILRKNLSESIYKVHGDYNMYDSYCKVLNCESDGWRNARNPKSSASGLFQCMRSTYTDMKKKHNLQLSFNEFRSLPLKEQAKFFDKYLQLYKNKAKLINTKSDQKTRLVYAYLMVLKPSCVGKKWDDPVFTKGNPDYIPNSGIKHNNGVIKISDVYNFAIRKFNS